MKTLLNEWSSSFLQSEYGDPNLVVCTCSMDKIGTTLGGKLNDPLVSSVYSNGSEIYAAKLLIGLLLFSNDLANLSFQWENWTIQKCYLTGWMQSSLKAKVWIPILSFSCSARQDWILIWSSIIDPMRMILVMILVVIQANFTLTCTKRYRSWCPFIHTKVIFISTAK